MSGRLGDNCSTHEDCSTLIGHSRCDDVNMTCVCDVIAGYWPTNDSTCDIRQFMSNSAVHLHAVVVVVEIGRLWR